MKAKILFLFILSELLLAKTQVNEKIIGNRESVESEKRCEGDYKGIGILGEEVKNYKIFNMGLIEGVLKEKGNGARARYSGVGVQNGGDSFLNFGEILGVTSLESKDIKEQEINSSLIAKYSGVGIYNDEQKENFLIRNSGLIAGKIGSIAGVGEGETVYLNSDFTNSGNGSDLRYINELSLKNSGAVVGDVNIKGGAIKSSGEDEDVGAGATLIGSANGLYDGYSVLKSKILNSGLISGKVKIEGGTVETTADILKDGYYSLRDSGNGIYIEDFNKDKSVENSGVIVGNIKTRPVNFIKDSYIDAEEHSFSGNGVATSEKMSGTIKNNGVIKGTKSAIAAKEIDGVVENYGILVGKEIFSKGEELIANKNEFSEEKKLEKLDVAAKNYGLYIKIDENGKVKEIEKGENRDGVLNTTTSFVDGKYFGKILNGVGVENGSLVISKNGKVENSIVNGYKVAVSFLDKGKIEGKNSIFNGDILGNSNKNEIKLKWGSIVNGNISLKEGDDRLKIESGTKINGNIDGGLGSDKLELKNGVNIFYGIKNFEEIKVKNNVTFFETAKIENSNIKLDGGSVLLRVNDGIKNSLGEVIGHALYKNRGVFKVEKGDLIFGVNGKKDEIIDMGGTKLNAKNENLKTNSLVLDATLLENGDVKISTKDTQENTPTARMYTLVARSGEMAKLARTTLLEDKKEVEAKKALKTILDGLYKENPYSYSIRKAKESMKLFLDEIPNIKPKKGERVVIGKALYNKESSVSEVSGGMATIEYGASEKTSLGLLLGGSKGKIKKGGELKQDSLYLGVYSKYDIDNFRITGEIGYQYSSNKTERDLSNGYNSFRTDDNYRVNGLNTLLEGRYIYKVGNLKVEPKIGARYYYLVQDKVNEGYNENAISMEVKKKKESILELNTGVDFVYENSFEGFKLKNILSLNLYNNILEKDRDLKGAILGENGVGESFKIDEAKIPKIEEEIKYSFQYEKTNGMIYSLGVGTKFAENYKKNVEVSLGVGYRF